MRRVAILGGGFAGLCVAQRLANSKAQIFIIDQYWLDNNKRRGIPQANHLHVLLLEGQRLLESLFPGILKELLTAGATLVDWANDTYWQGPYGLYPRYSSPIKTLLFSRRLLDEIIYYRIIHSNRKVVFIKGKVTRLICAKKKIVAVKYLAKQKIYQLDADLFIECRGRGSNLATLLSESLFQVKKKKVENTMQYLSIKLPKSYINLPNCKQFYLQADKKKQPLGIVISPIENDHYILTFIATVKDTFNHIKTIDNLLALIKSMSLSNVISQKVDVTKFYIFRKLSNEKKYFSQLKLANLLVIGDAVCYLNPVYGQGMTIALKQIFTIDKSLNKPYLRQQKQIEHKSRLAWWLAISEDLRWQRNKMPIIYCINKLLTLGLSMATRSMTIHSLFLRILHMNLWPRNFKIHSSLNREEEC
ncbi:FAD-dependent monooxygenase [Legionella sp. D16C41]|uniref:FAD-dependent monooxygenase n=1 Tax=Legionella sp. D16C41 TaxID=3402688 RepID=UPI003AF86754